MKDINKHIDKLFRAAFSKEKEPVAFREDDWIELEQRLDQHSKRKQLLFWLKAASGIAAICMVGLSWWLLGPGYHKLPVQQATSIEKNHQQLGNQQNGVAEVQGKIDEKKKTSTSKVVDSAPSEKQAFNRIAMEKTTEIKGVNLGRNSWADIHALSSLEIPERKIGYAIQEVKAEVLAEAKTMDRLEDHSAELEKKIVSRPKQRRITFGLLAAPVLNGVDHLNRLEMGHDVGFLLTIGLTEKWSVSTGMVYAKKLYETEFHTYNSVDNGWDKYGIQNVDADCRVLDIPLNFNYTVINKGRNIIGLSTGLSSYFMLREDYRLVYPEQTNRPPKNYSLINENKHLLSVLNLQLSYERRLTPHIGISFQPYLKIPMNDIGFAKVRLQSLGVAVNMNWNINLGSKK